MDWEITHDTRFNTQTPTIRAIGTPKHVELFAYLDETFDGAHWEMFAIINGRMKDTRNPQERQAIDEIFPQEQWESDSQNEESSLRKNMTLVESIYHAL